MEEETRNKISSRRSRGEDESAMSRRDGSDSHSKRFHSSSRSERDDPSVKRSRGDGRLATERTDSRSRTMESGRKTSDRDQKRDRSSRDEPGAETKRLGAGGDDAKNGSALKTDVKHSSDSRDAPRPRSFSQHDERGSAAQGGHRSDRQAADYRRQRDQKEHRDDRVKHKMEENPLQDKGECARSHGDGDSASKHERFVQLEAEEPPSKKRPAFQEQEKPMETEHGAVEDPKLLGSDQPLTAAGRREERENYRSRGFDRHEGQFRREDGRYGRREVSDRRNDLRRNDYSSRGDFNGRGWRGRDRFGSQPGERNTYQPGERNTNQPGGVKVEKWKHDLYDEANRSPPPKNEEEQIAKVEALLAL